MATMNSMIPVLVEAATQAPSSHNTQPWRFTADGSALELHADRTRALPVNDPRDRELTISCGAALLNLRVAAAHTGLAAEVKALPDGQQADVLARIELAQPATFDTDKDLGRLYDAIPQRRTHRGAFTGERVPSDVVERLVSAAAAESGDLQVISEEAREAVAALVEEGDRRQFADPRWRRELAGWMHSTRSHDGLVVPLPALHVTRLVVSTMNLGRRTGAKDAALVRQTPLLVALATSGDTPADWLAAGQALQRMLLTAAAEDLSAGYVNQPCQIGGELRQRLADELGGERSPQAVLRMGKVARPAGATARRPAADVLTAT